MVKIYTKTGDSGSTSLFGGERVPKGHIRLDAYGSLDELNAYLGWFRSGTQHRDLAALVDSIQPALFDIGAHLATPKDAAKAQAVLPPLEPEPVIELERAIDTLEGELEPLNAFILPGGTPEGALLHVTRAVCRRAERSVVRAGALEDDPLPGDGLAYLNRLSDLLFVMARVVNSRASAEETRWDRSRSSK